MLAFSLLFCYKFHEYLLGGVEKIDEITQRRLKTFFLI